MSASSKSSSASSAADADALRVPPERFLLRFRIGRFLLSVLFRTYFRVTITGAEVVPESGPVILAANHQSFLDPPMVGLRIVRPPVYLARRSLFRNRFFGALIRYFGAAPIDREGPGVGSLRQSLRFLEAGRVLVLFPEGTRSRDGSVGPFRPGVALLAEKTNAVVVPVRIRGGERTFPKGAKFPRPGRMSVRFGEPLRLREGEETRAFLRRIEAAVRGLE